MPDRQYTIRIVTAADGKGIADTTRGLGELKDAGVDTHKQLAAGAEHSEIKHRDLHAVIRAVHGQFPLLGEVAHLALSGIGFAVAGIIGAFAFLQRRLESLQQAMSGLELPNITPTEIGRITAAAKAYDQYADAIKKASDSYHSIDSASDRTLEKIKTQLEETKKLLAAQKGRELANLETQKDSMSPEQFDQAKGLIESRYGRAGVEAEQNADAQTLFQKAQRAARLAVDSQTKLKQARGIHVASAEDDAKTEGDLKAQADAAKKRVEEGRKWISDLDDLPNMDLLDKAAFIGKYHWNFGDANPRDIRRLQEEGIANAQPPIDRYNSFLRRKASREQMRKRRSDLESSAATEAGEAASFDESFPNELSGLRHRRAMGDVESAVETAQAIEHGVPTTPESNSQLQGVASKIAGHTMNLEGSTKMMDWAAQSIGNFTQSVDRLANAMARIGEGFSVLNSRVSQLEARRPPTRSIPGGQP